MTRLTNLYKNSPTLRAGIRAFTVAVVGYVVFAIKSGEPFEWRNVLWSALTSGGYAIIGILTPVEPKVGVKTDVS